MPRPSKGGVFFRLWTFSVLIAILIRIWRSRPTANAPPKVKVTGSYAFPLMWIFNLRKVTHLVLSFSALSCSAYNALIRRE
jgi:hypothetical protein